MKSNDSAKDVLYKYYHENREKSKFEIASHIIALGYPKSSVYRWINILEQGKSLVRKKGSGRPKKIATKSNIRKIEKRFNHRSGCSQRRAARRLRCSQSWISKILKKYTNIRCYKKIKKPKMSELQKLKARPKCRKMLVEYENCDFIIDDESYFTLKHSNQPGNDRFYSDDLNMTPDDAKFNFKAKYEKKLLVWLCISPKGVSKPFFVPSGLAVDGEVYLEQFIKKGIVPFIEQHYKKDEYVFWPDLASAHYAKVVTKYLTNNNINFVPKHINPANVPKARPIEDFWGNLKASVYEGDWVAQTLDQLKDRIKYCISKMDLEVVQKHSMTVRKRLDRIRRYGP